MRPAVTTPAAQTAYELLADATISIYSLKDSPTARTELAITQMFLPAGQGCSGMGIIDPRQIIDTAYASASYATWPTTVSAIPELAADLTARPDTLHTLAAAFAVTYHACSASHSTVVNEYSRLDALHHHYVTGHRRSHFRPN